MENQNINPSEQSDVNSKSENKSAQASSSEDTATSPLNEYQKMAEDLKAQLAKVIVGQNDFIELLLVSLLTNGHVLIEGVPGIAKTLTAKLFAKSINADFSRIQFTPDLMPSDVLGTSVFNAEKAEFEFKAGPIFSNMVLIDEINRAPAKTQSALFEVMEEKQVTIDGHQYDMEAPFMVLATQNPIEQEGTYALPEAQLDRFIFKIKLSYPNLEEEVKIIDKHHQNKAQNFLQQIETVISKENVSQFKADIHKVNIEPKIMSYIAEIVHNTRQHPHLLLGASPRASVAIMLTAKAFAILNGRDFVTPDDVKRSLKPVLNHRIVLSPEREMEGMTTEDVVDMIVKSIEIPR
ncbi:MoxR family ATPase [Flavobacteriaceae bacterium 14752]|nr:MoxR family ATPase [Flavobacteriaceae bacterium 14752]